MTRTTPEQRAALARDIAYAREHGHQGRILRSYYEVDDAAAFLADAEALAEAEREIARLRKLCEEAAMSLLCQCEACDAMRASLRAAAKGGNADD